MLFIGEYGHYTELITEIYLNDTVNWSKGLIQI